MAAVVQEAVPEHAHARAVLADAAWPSLRGWLAEVERAGEDPVEFLAAVVGRGKLS
ncbi:hypothetical protein [Streptomyces sp. NPDC047097]|uniref:hypothetical protein n=1 Tax=Streptomyces sp. NPDC047097 TaxID=3155260 RepID=UPI003411F535